MKNPLSPQLNPGHQAPRGTVVHLTDELFTHPGVVGLLHLVPHLAVGVTEAREGAERHPVGVRPSGPHQPRRQLTIGVAASGLGAGSLSFQDSEPPSRSATIVCLASGIAPLTR